MLPSRGFSMARPGLAPAMRQIVPSRIASPRSLHISARPVSRAATTSRLATLRSDHAASLRPSSAAFSAGAASVFSSRTGATRNLSLWPFSSPKPETPAEASAAATEPLTPAPAPATAADASAAIPEQAAASNPPASDSFSDLDFVSIADIPEQIGYLKSLGLDFGYGPTSCAQYFLEHVHVYSGMPWWGSIIAVAAIWRAALFMPSVKAARHSALMSKTQNDPKFKELREQFNEATFRTKDQQAAMTAQAQMKAMTRASGAKFRWIGVPMLTVPFSIGMYRLLRAMSGIPVPGLETGGFLWATDLTIPDPYYILPILNVALGVAMFQSTRKANSLAPPNPMMENMMGFMRYGLPPIIFLSTFWLPASVNLFLATVSAGAVLQSTVTVTPAFRRWADLPALPTGPPTVRATEAAADKWQAPTSAKDLRAKLSDAGSGLTGKGEKVKGWEKATEYEDKRAAELKQKEARRMEDLKMKRGGRRR